MELKTDRWTDSGPASCSANLRHDPANSKSASVTDSQTPRPNEAITAFGHHPIPRIRRTLHPCQQHRSPTQQSPHRRSLHHNLSLTDLNPHRRATHLQPSHLTPAFRTLPHPESPSTTTITYLASAPSAQPLTITIAAHSFPVTIALRPPL